MIMRRAAVALGALAAVVGMAVAQSGSTPSSSTYTVPLGGPVPTGGAGAPTGTSTTTTTWTYGEYMQQAMQGLQTMLGPNTNSNSAGFLTGLPSSAFSSSSLWSGGNLQDLIAQYCTEPAFVEPALIPPTFVGPAASMLVTTGLCALVFDETTKVLSLACEKPKVEILKLSAVYSSKYIAPVQYQTKACAIEKQFGTPITEVLYTFDKSQPFDPAQAVAQITAKLQALIAQEQSQYSASGLLGSIGQQYAGSLLNNSHRISLTGPQPTPTTTTTTSGSTTTTTTTTTTGSTAPGTSAAPSTASSPSA